MVQANRQSNTPPAPNPGGTRRVPPPSPAPGRRGTASSTSTGFNLNPTTFVQSGLLDDVDVTFLTARFTMYDYNGQQPQPVLALEVVMQTEDGNEYQQYYSAGDKASDNFDPSDDGTTVVPKSEHATMSNSSNLAKFLESLLQANFPPEQLEAGDMSVLDGMQCHVRRVTQERKGLVQTGANAGRPQQTLLVESIIAYPGESPAQPKRGQTTTRPTSGRRTQTAGTTPARGGVATGGRANGKAGQATEAAEPSQEVIDKTIDLIGEVLAKNNGQLNMANLSGKLFKAAQNDPDREAIVNLAWDQEFLGSSDKWSFDGATISL